MLNIALPKGRLGDEAYGILAAAGYTCDGLEDDSRKLIFTNPDLGIRYFWAKPSDVGVYVERGAADVGIVGKDCLMEQSPDVYELMDLGIGNCKLAVAARTGFSDDGRSVLRVATKFVNCSRAYFESVGRDIDIIKLNGSIEIAPVLGLSDVIVDIVQTGQTLKENGLEVVEDIEPLSARLIANKANYEFKRERIQGLMGALVAQMQAAPSNGAPTMQKG